MAFELINMGIPGIGPREYLAVFIHEGLQLKPDMVLLSFFIGNDFLETTKVNRQEVPRIICFRTPPCRIILRTTGHQPPSRA